MIRSGLRGFLWVADPPNPRNCRRNPGSEVSRSAESPSKSSKSRFVGLVERRCRFLSPPSQPCRLYSMNCHRRLRRGSVMPKKQLSVSQSPTYRAISPLWLDSFCSVLLQPLPTSLFDLPPTIWRMITLRFVDVCKFRFDENKEERLNRK